jgi:hypothetical protein
MRPHLWELQPAAQMEDSLESGMAGKMSSSALAAGQRSLLSFLFGRFALPSGDNLWSPNAI